MVVAFLLTPGVVQSAADTSCEIAKSGQKPASRPQGNKRQDPQVLAALITSTGALIGTILIGVFNWLSLRGKVEKGAGLEHELTHAMSASDFRGRFVTELVNDSRLIDFIRKQGDFIVANPTTGAADFDQLFSNRIKIELGHDGTISEYLKCTIREQLRAHTYRIQILIHKLMAQERWKELEKTIPDKESTEIEEELKEIQSLRGMSGEEIISALDLIRHLNNGRN